MTDKRFENIDLIFLDGYIRDNVTNEDISEENKVVKKLNDLHEEIKLLEKDIDYFNRTYEIEERGLDCVPAMCTMMSPTKSRIELFKENERLIKMLDNVANYMQKQHKDMPLDDFVEWWNNIATEGLE